MKNYFYTDAMKGETPFKCYVCGKLLISSIEGEYKITLDCMRCKTKIVLETKDPIPSGLVVKHGELVKI